MGCSLSRADGSLAEASSASAAQKGAALRVGGILAAPLQRKCFDAWARYVVPTSPRGIEGFLQNVEGLTRRLQTQMQVFRSDETGPSRRPPVF